MAVNWVNLALEFLSSKRAKNAQGGKSSKPICTLRSVCHVGTIGSWQLAIHYVTKWPKNCKSEPEVETYLDGKRVLLWFH